MKVRRSYFTAAVCVALLGTLSGCSEPGLGNQQGDEATELGTVQFPLEATGESGLRYRLRNAVFEIRSKRTARLETTLFSENDFFSSFLSAELDAGEYQVTLQPGWFIEQLTDGTSSGGFGGSGSTGGGFGGSFGGPEGPGSTQGPVGETGSTRPILAGPAPTSTMDFFDDELPPAPTATTSATATTVPAPSSTFDTTFTFPPDGSSGGGGIIVNAALDSNAIQDFTIFPREESFVFFNFRVGDNVVSFDPGRVNIGITITEDGVQIPDPDLCERPADARRPAVMETSLDALRLHTLRDAFNAMAANEGFETDGETLYHQIIDSYATAEEGRMADAVHCGDETTNGEPSLNGFRIDCNRRERFQFDNLDVWQPTAFVNRIDLAPQSGAHCGQQRLVFSNNSDGRMFFILEAQIPNPQPELGVEGCAPLGEFWSNLVRVEDPFTRGLLLREAFFDGSPELQAQGFGPFVAASHYTVGTGQIRTNNFNDFIWTLREFKLTTDESALKAIPFPVAESPNGELWNDLSDQPAGPACRDAFIQSLQGVLTDEPGAMSFIVPQECKNSESRNDFFSEDYGLHMSQGSGSLIEAIDEAVAGTELNAFNIADRARFSGSCIGCHNEMAFRDLGRGVTAPLSLDFVHVGEFQGICPDGNPCFQTSSALNDSFLPHRIAVLNNFVGVPLPPRCDDDFPGFDGGIDDSDTSNDVSDVSDITMEDTDVFTDEPVAMDAGAASPDPVEIVDVPEPVEMPSADIPVEELVELETEIRETYGDFTLGGQPAQVSH
jgi:hypothetical protein